MYRWILPLLLSAGLLLSGCATTASDPTAGLSAAELYAKARERLNAGAYQKAIDYYETLESRYPFGDYATQAQLDVAYAYYRYNEPESAIAAADRFIKLHPRHPAVDYAYYLKGLVNFGLKKSVMDKLYTRDLADYDKTIMQQSYDDFAILVKRFPDSSYAPDAIKRMVYLRNQLARAEIKVAEFYLQRHAPVAAANRARSVVESYQGSDSVKRALQIMIIAYRKLELDDLARDAERVLKLNYGDEALNEIASASVSP